jgi:hypothetical protein
MKHIASLASGMLFVCVIAGAAEPAKFEAPDGFNGKHWGDPLSTFEGFGGDPFSMGGAFTRGKVVDTTFSCIVTLPTLPTATEQQAGGGSSGVSSNAADSCDLRTSAASDRVKGRGYHVLVEYRNEKQGLRLGANGVLFYPVIYQFCAHWDSIKKEEPPNFKDLEKFCGMRLMFKGETDAELAALPPDSPTRYDQALDMLIAKFGRPFRFEKRGRVVIEDQQSGAAAAERRFQTWRWCPPHDRDIGTPCPASVVLSYDAEKHWGYVLYSTPEVWEYAYARENGGFKGEYLYRMLHAERQLPAAADAQQLATSHAGK